MIFCVECFRDTEVRSIVKSLDTIGNCPLCGATETHIYDTQHHDDLVPIFEDLLDIYTPIANFPSDFPREKASLLKDELCDVWNMFNLDKEKVYGLITGLCSERYVENPSLFYSPVGIMEFMDNEYLATHSLLKVSDWDEFVRAIKTESRFHTSHMNTGVLKAFCGYAKKTYKAGSTFYRARISPKKGLPLDQMMAPPREKAVAGRVNPEGISYLYLSNDVPTTFTEIRAGAHDYVSVGKFVLRQDISIVDLTAIDQISAFMIPDRTQHAINKAHLRRISDEIARPVRQLDSALDYLPTQYICDFIQSIKEGGMREYQGIRYNSTRSQDGGYNLAIFEHEVIECQEVTVYDIKGLHYSWDESAGTVTYTGHEI